MSIKPGERTLSPKLTSRAPAGISIASRGPTATMRPSSTTTHACETTPAAVRALSAVKTVLISIKRGVGGPNSAGTALSQQLAIHPRQPVDDFIAVAAIEGLHV